LDAMCEMIQKAAAQTAVERNLDISLLETKAVAPVDMDDGIVEQFCEAAESTVPGAWRRMPSGALHDAMNLAPRLPTGMIFVPSIGGISHAFEEDTQREHLVAGVQVMVDVVARLANLPGKTG
ncbi:MAG: M20/M25/M40 family metallo-hydrolase, partial [Rhodospirillales bacterium]|nr:M20/M25/M40 family metallo-hydrolase [Rhodospirillales bacterium]